jgi:hypothetical protein
VHSRRDRVGSQGSGRGGASSDPVNTTSTTPTAIGIGAPSASPAAGQGSTMSPATGTSVVEQSLSAGGHQKSNTMESESQPVPSAEPLSFSGHNDTSCNTLAEGNIASAITAPTETLDIGVGGDPESQSVPSAELLSFSAHNVTSGNTLTEGNLALAITAPTEMFDIAVGGDKRSDTTESKSQSVSSTEVLSFSARNITSGDALTEGNLASAMTAPTETFEIAESKGTGSYLCGS